MVLEGVRMGVVGRRRRVTSSVSVERLMSDIDIIVVVVIVVVVGVVHRSKSHGRRGSL